MGVSYTESRQKGKQTRNRRAQRSQKLPELLGNERTQPYGSARTPMLKILGKHPSQTRGAHFQYWFAEGDKRITQYRPILQRQRRECGAAAARSGASDLRINQ